MSDCEHFDLFGGDVRLRFCPDKHVYHVQPAAPGVSLPESPDLKPNTSWLYVPSVTSIGRMLGGDKVNGLLWWAVDQTLRHLDANLASGVVVPTIEGFLDCAVGRIESALGSRESLSRGELEDTINALDTCVGNDLVGWSNLRGVAAKARDANLGNAADLGTVVHNWLEEYVNHKYLNKAEMPAEPSDPVVQRAIKKWLAWEAKQDIEWLMTEERLYSHTWHYAGTMDAVAVVNGKLTLIDYKTSKKVYPEHRLQTAAYSMAIKEEYNEDIEQRIIIRLSKTTGETKATNLEDLGFTIKEDFTAFAGLRAVYRLLKGA